MVGADRFAQVKDVFNTLTFRRKSRYTCDFSLTVDERLTSLISNCSFITSMLNKLDKLA